MEEIMNRNEVKEKVQGLICEQMGLKAEDVREECDLEHDLAADSMDQIEIIMLMEEEFDIEIPDVDAEKINTVGQLINYVEGKVVKVEASDVKAG
jgi:acyl carrier protein